MLYAEDLKKCFGVYGHFYELMLNGHNYACRATLDIMHHNDTPLDLAELWPQQPQLLVVMMNPGGSRPLATGYKPRVLSDIEDLGAHRELVPTMPDATQYQIMRVMVARKINHARIVNLSDLREPKSQVFFELMTALNNQGLTEHSIFNARRHPELDPVLKNKSLQILVGWGRDKALLPLAQWCLDYLQGRVLRGIAVDDSGQLYAHPSPMLQTMKESWLKAILAQMQLA